MPPRPVCHALRSLLGVIDRARFADHLHLDLTGILHRLLDLLGDVAREAQRRQIVDVFRPDDDAHFAPGLQRVALLDAVEAVGDLFQRLDAADVGFQAFTPSAGTRAGNGVGGFDDVGFDAFLLDFVVMAGNAVDDLLALTP